MVEILAVFGAAVSERGIAFRLEITLGRTEQGAVVLLLDNGIGTEAGRFLHNRGTQAVGCLAAVNPSHAAAAEFLLQLFTEVADQDVTLDIGVAPIAHAHRAVHVVHVVKG